MRSTRAGWREYEMLGVKVHAISQQEFIRAIGRSVETRDRLIVVYQNLSGIYIYHRDAGVRSLSKSSVVRCDGVSLIKLGRLLGYSLEVQHRTTGIDWLPALAQASAENNWRLYFVGAEAAIVDRGIEVLKKAYPDLQMAGHHGFFTKDPNGSENRSVIQSIQAFAPDVLVVGMGMPIQENWILDNLSAIDAPAILTCGATMEFISGKVRTPPRWTGPAGLEWLFRLVDDPGRFWRRYLVEPWALVPLFAKDLWKHRLTRRY